MLTSDGTMVPLGPQKTRTHQLSKHWQGGNVSVGISTKSLLRIILTLILIKQLIVFTKLIVDGRVHMDMYTYWSYTMLTIFYVIMWLALWLERTLLTIVAMYLFPIPLGTTFVVSLAIVIVIQQNAAVFSAAATSGQTALNLIHTGDWILHNLPLMEVLLLLACGWLLYVRSIVPPELNALRSGEWRAAYVLYVMLVPLVPLGIYASIFDISEHYPTGIPNYILWFGLVLFDLLWMGLYYLVITVSADIEIKLGTFAPWLNATFGGSGSSLVEPLTSVTVVEGDALLKKSDGGPIGSDGRSTPTSQPSSFNTRSQLVVRSTVPINV